jgi:peroxiredoxin
MRPLPSVLLMLAILLTAVGAAVLIAGPPPSSQPPPATPRISGAREPTAPPVAARAATPAPGPRGRLSLAEAIKELDLVRPARPKLADDFTVASPGGGSFHLAGHRGKVVMVNFWATWCPPCLEEMPAMERLYRRHKDAGFTLVAVSVDTDPKKVTPFVTEHRLTMPIGLDPRMELANTYGVRALPSSFVIGPDGQLAALAIGPRHWDSEAAHALVEGLRR